MPETTNRYTYAEAAAKLGIAVSTLRHWVSDGKITPHRLGTRLVRFTDSDLEAAYTRTPPCQRPRARRRR